MLKILYNHKFLVIKDGISGFKNLGAYNYFIRRMKAPRQEYYDVLMESDKEIRTMMDNDYTAKYTEVIGKVYAEIDYTKFRDDINKTQIISIINWIIDGYSNSEIANLKRDDLTEEKYRSWLKEIDEYMEILKKVFYKEDNRHG